MSYHYSVERVTPMKGRSEGKLREMLQWVFSRKFSFRACRIFYDKLQLRSYEEVIDYLEGKGLQELNNIPTLGYKTMNEIKAVYWLEKGKEL